MSTDGDTVPSFPEFIEPLVRVLDEHPEGIPTSEAYEEVAERVGLDEAQRAEMIPSGQEPRYKNRIGWAHDRLKRAGLSQSVERGVWQLTEEGESFAASHEDGINHDMLRKIVDMEMSSDGEVGGLDEESETVQDNMTPDERIDVAIRELHESLSEELLTIVKERSAEFFERLVLDVLQAMGYGTGEHAIDHRGSSHDGGIDGLISQDRLGLEQIYIQAKRWDGQTVGRPELQKFYGALSSEHADKGVFITTSRFSRQARKFANNIDSAIVLVDGDQLTDLMIEYGVGVREERSVQVVDVERDYFEVD